MAGLPGWQASVVSSQKDVLIAAQMLGHAHVEVAARHYARADERTAERAAEALERPPFGSSRRRANGSAGGYSAGRAAALPGTRNDFEVRSD